MDLPTFGGPALPIEDIRRLDSQVQRVFAYLSDGQWHGLDDIASVCYGSEASISARMRDLRKPEWGSHTIERERLGNGTNRYRMIANGPLLSGVGAGPGDEPSVHQLRTNVIRSARELVKPGGLVKGNFDLLVADLRAYDARTGR